VFTHTSFTEPPEMYRVNWDGSALYRLTWVNEELRKASTSRQYPVSFTLADRKTYRGVLALPADAPFPPKNVPIVVYQEGGPGGSMINAWAAIVERPYALLPNFGIGVLMVPLAGRYGNGPQVYNELYDSANFGQRDVDQQAEIARQMISRGWTSQRKLGIVGCSYGGYFALQSTLRHPDLYAASNPQCSLVDSVTEWSRGYDALMPYLQGLPPWANPDEYRRDSPIFNASRIKTPTLTFQGTLDFLPITLGENTHLQIVNAGTPAKMLQFVGAGHGLVAGNSSALGTPAKYERYAAQEQILWFQRYLTK
jgi:dipeptidyl aminopeptidase/acylaminoacyl peptidase